MRDDGQRQPVAREIREQVEHAVGVLGVEVAGRLVAEEQARSAHEGARDRHALLLAARQARREEVRARREAHLFERSRRPLATALTRRRDVELAEHDVLERGAMRQEVERLEDEADPPAAQPGARKVVERRDVAPLELVHAVGLAVEEPEDVEQRRLPRPRRSDDGEPLAGPDGEVDGSQGVHGRVDAEGTRHASQADDGVAGALHGGVGDR